MTLHSNEAITLVELWVGIKNYVPAKDQRSAAEHYIQSIDDAGLVDFSVSSAELYGVCDMFDKALQAYCQENGLDEEELDEWDE